MNTKIIISSILFVFVFISGIWMSRLGKPYQQLLFTFHKLISLAAILLGIIASIAFNKQIGLNTLQVVFAIIIVFLIVVIFATGGILSAKQETLKTVLIVHRAAPFLLMACLATYYIQLLKA